MAPELPPREVEFLVRDVPPLGWKKISLTPAPAQPDEIDAGTRISLDGLSLEVEDDGTFHFGTPDQSYPGLLAIEDAGDRGDTYDFDPIGGGILVPDTVEVERRRHANGIRSLRCRRTFQIPAALREDRLARASETVLLEMDCLARLVPGTGRVDLEMHVDDPGRDHRLRVLLPTGKPGASFWAATTFDMALRESAAAPDEDWVHPAPKTFCHQGALAAGGLWVGAPGLPEAEVSPEGVVALTLQRSVEWLARTDLATRPEPAGPMIRTPEAQCLEPFSARLSLAPWGSATPPLRAPAGLRAVVAGEEPRMPPRTPILELPPGIELSAWKPAACGEGWILRLLNPTPATLGGVVRFGLPVGGLEEVSLDEQRRLAPLPISEGTVSIEIRPHGILTLHGMAPS